ncbi:uncharacterized protein PWA37_002406 [Arxiozyma heterogenica]|uniref:Uncharacterized protein n=1 Tax=Arxiozyma heterogenica TaxID=278026 RepID=A0AAN7WSZ6_9SACH|nr:hypothetical protein RI543_000548 [Kazachstania heterogenica]
MNDPSLQELDSSPYTPKDSINIRKFFKVHQACNQLLDAVRVIYNNSLSEEEIEVFSNSTNKIENAIAESPATYIASYLSDIKSTIDLESIFQHYSFNGVSSPVHHFIHYPVVSDPTLETLAFIHRSYPNMNVNLTETQKTLMSNERLEFLGDSWLGALIAYIIYEKYPYADAGALSKMKSAIVNNSNLEKISTKLRFKERLKENIPRFSMKFKDKFSKYYADCVEAYIGALVIDRFSVEFKEIADWLEELSQDKFAELGPEMLKKPLNKNAKGELAELLQFNKIGAKIFYRRITTTPPFTVEVLLGDKVLALGTGANVREAEQRAAMEVLGNPDLIQKYSLYKIETNDVAKHLVEEIPIRKGILPGHKVDDIETPISIRRSLIAERYNTKNSIESSVVSESEKFNSDLEQQDLISISSEEQYKEQNKEFRGVDSSIECKAPYDITNIDALAEAILEKMGTVLRPMVTGIVSDLEETKNDKFSKSTMLKDDKKTLFLRPIVSNIPSLPPKPVRRNNATLVAKTTEKDKAVTDLKKKSDEQANKALLDNIPFDKQASSTLYTTLGSVNLFPTYEIIMLDSGGFRSTCSIMGVGTVLAEGIGRSKKIAQHISASNALQSEALQKVLRDAVQG